MATSVKTATNSNIATNNSGTPISDKVTDSLHQSVDSLGEHTSVAEDKLRQTASASVATLDEKQRQVKSYWDHSVVGKYTKENPVATAGIAFAAGMLLTTFFRKK